MVTYIIVFRKDWTYKSSIYRKYCKYDTFYYVDKGFDRAGWITNAKHMKIVAKKKRKN